MNRNKDFVRLKHKRLFTFSRKDRKKRNKRKKTKERKKDEREKKEKELKKEKGNISYSCQEH